MISRRKFLTLGAATAGSGVLSAADAFAIEPGFSLVVTEWTVKHPDWPASARPLRIGVLTDIHAVEPWMSARRIGAIVDRMNALKPDLVVLLGDYVNALRPRFCAAPVPVAEWMAPLGELTAPAGVYAVPGNHDWWSDEIPQIRRRFEKAGIHFLQNHAVRASRDGDRFWVAGLDDQLAYRTHGADDLEGTLRHVRDSSPVLLLAHEPSIFQNVPGRVTLTLAGHTHGGQVYVPFIGRRGDPALFQLRIRAYPRGRTANDRVERPWAFHLSGPFHGAAGNCAGHAGKPPNWQKFERKLKAPSSNSCIRERSIRS